MPTNSQITTERTVFVVVRFLLPIFLLLTLSLGFILMNELQPVSDDPESESQLVEVTSGMNARNIATMLANSGIIKNADVFVGLIRATRADGHLKAGYYLLEPTMTPMEILQELQAGQAVSTQVLIPEGFELRQIAQEFAKYDLVDPDLFLELASDARLVFGNELPFDMPITTLEGYLYPDTYHIEIGQSEADIIRQMVRRFNEVVLPEVQEQLESTQFTLHEIVTLASIVEREIMVDHERPLVASVYLNRLAIDMPLQADPTVRYVMTEDRSRVLYRDLEIESPYNTYRNRGLPPGPIANPGLASILAVLNPADADFLFFVSKRDGTHQFTHTFEEHVRARQQLGY